MFPTYSKGPLVVLALSALAASACASMSVSSYAQRGFDPRQYRSYQWGAAEAGSTGDPRLDSNRFFEDQVRSRVDHALAARGFERTEGATADLLVHYHASVTQKIDVRHLDPGSGYCEESDCAPYVYDSGTLFVDLVDARTNRLVWRGWAEGGLAGAVDDQAWMERRIDEAVTRIIATLPGTL